MAHDPATTGPPLTTAPAAAPTGLQAHGHRHDADHGHDPAATQTQPDAPPMAPKTRWQRIRGVVALVVGLLAGVVLLRQVDPHVPGIYPVCPTKALTGLDCPGCGGLRATNELAHLNIPAALDDNALVVLAVPVVAVLIGRAFYYAWTGRPIPVMAPARARWLTIALVVLLTVFTVVRNIPGSFLASG